MTPFGTLVLIVGPSGVGKDTVLAGAREQLRGDPRFHFPIRVITRPSDATETVKAVTPETFDAMETDKAFGLSWRANGHAYGVQQEDLNRLSEGAIVVCNVSRTIIALAIEQYKAVSVVHITAPAEVIAARLKARGRETAAEIASRKERAAIEMPDGVSTITISNSGNPEAAVEALLNHLQNL